MGSHTSVTQLPATLHNAFVQASGIPRISVIGIGITTGEFGSFSSQLPVLLDTTITRWVASPTLIVLKSF